MAEGPRAEGSAEDAGWREFYETRGLGSDSHFLPLIDVCPERATCWASIAERRSEYRMARPYVGTRYQEGRVMGFGQNLNDAGAWRDLVEFIGEPTEVSGVVRWHQLNGYRSRVGLGSEGYRTMFWTFAIAYLTVLTNRLGVTAVADPFRDLPAASSTWDLVAFSEVVKCSPKGEYGRPSPAMFQRCPGRYSAHEAGALRPTPRAGVVIGLRAADSLAGGHQSLTEKKGRFLTWSHAGTRFFGVPHPASRGGGSAALVHAFDELVLTHELGLP
jgi:hypothetical protein